MAKRGVVKRRDGYVAKRERRVTKRKMGGWQRERWMAKRETGC